MIRVSHAIAMLVALAIASPGLAQKRKSAPPKEEAAAAEDAAAMSDAPVIPDASAESSTKALDKNPNGAPTPGLRSWWNPYVMHHSLGVETAAQGVLGSTVIMYGYSTGSFGLDTYLGYAKAASDATEAIATEKDSVGAPEKTITTVLSGTTDTSRYVIGFQPKMHLVRNKWLRVSGGLMMAYIKGHTETEQTGSKVKTIADTADSDTYTMVETDVGQIETVTAATMVYGPRLSTEIYLKWFPHVSLGFGTGILMTSGGTKTVTTTSRDRTYTVTNGDRADPTVDETTTSTRTTVPGSSGETFAIGGTAFSLTQTFQIRYVW